MARTRSIKPGISKNEELGDLSRDHRLLFTWSFMLADREGLIEFRPKRIKAELFPYDSDITEKDVEQWVCDLSSAGFYLIYEVDGKKVIQILNFVLHQNPHKNEAPSNLPPPPNSENSGNADSFHEYSSNYDTLRDNCKSLNNKGSGNADTLRGGSRNSTLFSVLSDTQNTVTNNTTAHAAHDAMRVSADKGFDDIWKLYPKREGGNPKNRALKAYRARLKEGSHPDEILAGVKRYAEYIRTKGSENTSFVQQTATFLGPDKHYLESWGVSTPSKAPIIPMQQKDYQAGATRFEDMPEWMQQAASEVVQ